MELIKPHDDGFAGADCIVEADDPPRVLDTIQRWAPLVWVGAGIDRI